MISIIIAIDIKSPSICCSAYECRGTIYRDQPYWYHQESNETDVSNEPSLTDSSTDTKASTVRPIDGISHTIKISSIDPNTGYILIYDVLSAIDQCLDAVVLLLRERIGYQVVALGFSTFGMNLIGVDELGEPVCESATLSYACNREDVIKEYQDLRTILGQEKLFELNRRTGGTIQTESALPQLLAFYSNKENEGLIQKIARWQTISSIALHRWSGRPNYKMPISYSEASALHMLNFRECCWDEEVYQLLEPCHSAIIPLSDEDEDDSFDEIELLPPVVDFDDPLPFLRCGIPHRCDDGRKNDYFEKWPELRSAQLYLGVANDTASAIGMKCGGRSSSSTSSQISFQRIAVAIEESDVTPSTSCLLPMVHGSSSEHNLALPPGLFCYRVDRYRVLLSACLTDVDSSVKWACSELKLSEAPQAFDTCMSKVAEKYQKITRSSSGAPPPSYIVIDPSRMVSRSTGQPIENARFLQGTNEVNLMFACVEDMILRIDHVLSQINEVWNMWLHYGKARESILVATNDILKPKSLYAQMLADCSSMDVVVDADSDEANSRGVAVLISESLQRRPGCRIEHLNLPDEPLVIVHEVTSNKTLPAVEEHWSSARSAREALARARKVNEV